MRKTTLRRLASSLVLTVLLLAASRAARGALAQEPGEILSLGTAPAANAFTYQGRLNVDGRPANGPYDFRFLIFNQQTGGSQLGTTNTIGDVPVINGIFTVYLLSDPLTGVFTGGQRWLQVEVRPGSSTGAYTTLTRSPITPAPSAWGLQPGATLSGAATGYGFGKGVLNVENTDVLYSAVEARTASGTAVRGESLGGTPLVGYTGTGYGVQGMSVSTASARGYGGYFTSNGGVGVYGYSSAYPSFGNQYAPGVYGRSANGVGVYGVADSGTTGVGGRFEGTRGIYAFSTGSADYQGYAGRFRSDNYRGLYISAPDGWYSAYFDSGTRYGSGVAVNGRLYVTGDVYVDGNISAGGSKAGYVVDVCRNAGPEPLETGDVVVVVGSEAPVMGEIPVMLVRKAAAASSTAVVGVVDQLTCPTMETARPTRPMQRAAHGPLPNGPRPLSALR